MDTAIILLPAKIILSAGMVITITLVAEKASTRFAGVILGFPLGAGLTFFFTGIEQGALFAAESTPWAIQGLSATLVFSVMYQFFGLRSSRGGILGLIIPAISGLLGFFLLAYTLQHLLVEKEILRIILVSMIFVGSAIWFRRWPSPAIKHRVPVTTVIITCRASFAAITIVIITAVASHVGSGWTGIFAAFPTTLLPTILILHYHYGEETIAAVFREFPFGIIAIAIFSIAVYFSFPAFGVYIGIGISYFIAFLYLIFYEIILRPYLDQILPQGQGK